MAKTQLKLGRVVSTKMLKTVVVEVNERKAHPLYKKLVKKSHRFIVHTDDQLTVGDIVKIAETRPLSGRKRWRVLEVFGHGSK